MPIVVQIDVPSTEESSWHTNSRYCLRDGVAVGNCRKTVTPGSCPQNPSRIDVDLQEELALDLEM